MNSLRFVMGRRRAIHLAWIAALLLVSLPRSPRAEWVPLRDTSLVIAEGSALDFSGLAPFEEAGRSGRVLANTEGNLALASRPGTRVRFLCASLAWSTASGSYPDHATADLYAAQLRMHGYNLARLHFTDLILMTGRALDFDYDPDQLDRFRYLLAALKRQGIFWILDAMTSQEGALGDPSPDRWMERGDLKLRVHYDPAARRHWSRLVETLYGTVNPYTGLSRSRIRRSPWWCSSTRTRSSSPRCLTTPASIGPTPPRCALRSTGGWSPNTQPTWACGPPGPTSDRARRSNAARWRFRRAGTSGAPGCATRNCSSAPSRPTPRPG